ncbi:MAG TPA: thiamine pyrophosphate-binding protein, partial [Candidatus Goldiibacteriota bacterium]|nr:thiamine pyrophosphate-binding protein [Candidatus Goldiibacteriota bacterium]
EACSKFTNKPSAVLVTSGPGATNTITGLLGAFQDSIPCIFISGQAKLKQTVMNSGIAGLRQFGVQEANIIPIVESITKYAEMITDKNNIKYHLEKAVFHAVSGRPGPVWLDVPLDIQSANINENDLQGFNPQEELKSIKTEANNEEISYAVKSLAEAKRPVIIAGSGIKLSGAREELLKLINKAGIPVVTPVLGIDNLATDDEHYAGRIGTKGTRAGNFAMQNADLLISIGSRLSVSVTGHEFELFAREAKRIVVDIDPIEHSKNTIRIDKLIIADAKDFLKKLYAAIPSDISFAGWLNTCREWKEKYPVCLSEYKKEKNGINYYAFVDELTKRLKPDTTVISDAGSSFYVVSQSINVKRGQRYITSGAIATMGFGVPAAIGVSAGSGGPVAAITGDGSFQQNVQELSVIKKHNMPVKVFVMNNNGYFSIRQTQQKFFGGRSFGESAASGLWFPDTEKIAAAFELNYFRFDNTEAFVKGIEAVLADPAPALVEIILSENFEVIPTVSSVIKPDGTMVSKPLEDMYPFLSREEFLKNMIVKPVDE